MRWYHLHISAKVLRLILMNICIHFNLEFTEATAGYQISIKWKFKGQLDIWFCAKLSLIFRKTSWLLFMDRIQLLQGYTEPLRGGSLHFTTKSPEVPGIHLIDLGMMTGQVNLRATQWFWTWYPWIEIQHLNHYAIAPNLGWKWIFKIFFSI